jgi:hypothetical protein
MVDILPPARDARATVAMMVVATEPWIGTLREGPLHAALKAWCAEAGDQVETPVDGYVIDLVRGDLLIEIQTRGMSGMRVKLAALLGAGRRVRVVHPLAVDTWITKVDDDGVLLGRRRSPRHAGPTDAFAELVAIAPLLRDPNLEIDLVLIELEELRRHAPDGPWRRRGWRVVERRLMAVLDRRSIRTTADLAALLPADLVDPFTTADLAARLRRPRRLGQQIAYCLRGAGVIEPVDGRVRNVRYRRTAVPIGTSLSGVDAGDRSGS